MLGFLFVSTFYKGLSTESIWSYVTLLLHYNRATRRNSVDRLVNYNGSVLVLTRRVSRSLQHSNKLELHNRLDASTPNPEDARKRWGISLISLDQTLPKFTKLSVTSGQTTALLRMAASAIFILDLKGKVRARAHVRERSYSLYSQTVALYLKPIYYR